MTAGIALLALGIVGGSGFVSLADPPGSVRGDRLATGALCAGAALGIGAAVAAFVTGGSSAVLGRASLRLDPLAAMFLLQLFVIAAAGAVYATGYWSPEDHPENARRLRVFYGLTAAGLGLVFLAGDLLVFLVGWELMAVGAFLAITTEDRDPLVREVGRLYVFCTKAATLALMGLCAVWHQTAGSFALVPVAEAPPHLFGLAVVAFGIKAGVMPFHVWLPSAHGTAPSHVSALLSGVLIKVGIYGLVRILGLCVAAPAWWGQVVFSLGAVSAVLGVVFAIGQHDLKRLLAWHSVENIGIILLGLGLALTGRATGARDLVVLGLAGALLHTWNHGLFKSLLFLAAGSVIHGTGVRDIDRLGGLGRRMPYTSLAFLTGAVAICGLPPLNGFVSEFLVYSGLMRTLADPAGGRIWLFGGLGTPALALTGALALLCFAKVFGIAFLGEPRSREARESRRAPLSMLLPMAFLASLCVLVGMGSVALAPVLDAAMAGWLPPGPGLIGFAPLGTVSVLAIGLAAVLVGAALTLRGWLERAPSTVTWDCGYAAPAPRMQYTATSFADGVVGLFSWALMPVRHDEPVGRGPFPSPSRRESHVRDPALDGVLTPGARLLARGMASFHWFQYGSLQASIAWIVLGLVLLFVVSWS